jgi:hypothetical protein
VEVAHNWRTVTDALKRVGPVVAWFVGGLCGWRLSNRMDLLDAVLRGAAVWLAVLVLWTAGLGACQRVVGED